MYLIAPLFCAYSFKCSLLHKRQYTVCVPLLFYWVTLQLNSVRANECVYVCLTCSHAHLCISVCASAYYGSVVAPAGGMALVWYSAPRQHNETWERAAGYADRWPHPLDVRALKHLEKTPYWLLCMTSSSVPSGDWEAAEQWKRSIRLRAADVSAWLSAALGREW